MPATNTTAKKRNHTRLNKDRKKEIFLEELAQSCNVKTACEVAGIDRKTAYVWKDEDTDAGRAFANAWKCALADGCDEMHKEARRRAVDGCPETVYWQGMPVGEKINYSDTLLIFLMKAHQPDVYGDRRILTGPGGGPVAHDIDLLDKRQKEDAELRQFETELAATLAEAHSDDPE